MKVILSILVLSIMTSDLFAQQWVEEGHEIEFNRITVSGGFFGHTGCDRWTYSSDTLVEGEIYQVLTGLYSYLDIFMGDTIGYGDIVRPAILLRTNGDTTWYFMNNMEYMLANFNAQIGDQWVVDFMAPSSGLPLPPMTITVDSIGDIQLPNETRSAIYYSYAIEFSDIECVAEGNGVIVRGLYIRTGNFAEFILPVIPDVLCFFDGSDGHIFHEFSSSQSPTYSAEVTSNNYCFNPDVGLDGNKFSEIEIYPNPTSGEITIELPNQTREGFIEVFDMLGHRVMQQRFIGESNLHINLEAAEGMYLLRLTSEAGVYSTLIQKL